MTPEEKRVRAVELQTQYVARNREKINAYNREYLRKWRLENPERAKAARERFFANNPDARKRWKKPTPEQQARYDRTWCEKHPDKKRDKSQRYHARKMGAEVVEKIDRLLIYERDGGRCHLCGKFTAKSAFTLDHLIPLALGGNHTYLNLKVAHRSCNSRKGARFSSEPIAA